MIPGFKYLLEERGLSEATIRTFWLGACDVNGNIYMHAGFPNKELTLDFRFKDSALFPIFDIYGKMIAVSARMLAVRKDGPKYLNTRYSKADHLYGFNETHLECFKARKAYVVEGNVDTLRMHQAGIKNVVGMLGSNLSEKQLCLLSRFVDEVVLVPDGDKAGSKFLEKFKKLTSHGLSKLGLRFSFVTLPAGYDPDKFLQAYGIDDLFALEQPLTPTLFDKLKGI